MAGPLLSSSSEIILRALALESEGKLTQSLICYEEGIGLLLKCLKCESGNGPNLKLKLKEKVTAYISRAEEVKKTIQQKQKDCKYHEHLDIADGETGYGYRKLFSRFLDDGRVTCVKIDDPYIRNSFQIEKFSHFCEILVGSASPVNRIILQTGVDCDKPEEQLKKLETLKQDLQLHKVDFTWNFSSLLHDRQIRFNNGWVVKIGRGLDYIKNAPHKFVGLGVHDFDFRPCLQTTIDIFYEGEPPL
ncbi:unnamed protein product [Taenia asiatica]|uniref:MIT domain-containing protein n=1 Tax=Taenia asiatica TaxID=60517 RepID=A0A158R8C8_TAEAS|nr:unnamed protein product [Taenia asiatica]